MTKKVVLYRKRTTADRGTTLVSKRVHNAWLNELFTQYANGYDALLAC
ncbi:hypothetical protein Nizo1840_1151 [Lactiplantibacillus plantarum]|nr:hypothetical protein SF2A35B_0006 [Lactiplantibacillus plantarum]KZT80755.1 hypothetical protein Nizo1839_1523 [Lactiplantibacillus plantarum]KZT85035.1 hypothetical protein Nizo1840_1151 [Lactiplantibacillus plantarum]